ncbi:membrane-bound lytic murein transglycosylase D [Lysobacter niabensis]|uniref:Membrane-bound lytic murein transglycosylase D n=1 Tax=Agrilutibacter niabensis TaxID=380628 RepID=A0ABU1VL14_9GAMM|nr:transglycosylase SLT domain-containing protein [Lysobacter niabensis]MDR7098154.1 membrane-bound lytic murein transglycosylase D [Lysobacter niabensis]
MTARAAVLALALLLAAPACASAADAVLTEAGARNGREIYQRFREGLADPECKADASARWQAHFAHAPRQLAAGNDDVLPLFGYVVDSVRAANLPTEFALIPFVESGYKPGARSPQGTAGLWQMIAVTARNHKVSIRAGYDGRLSPVDSTTAAVRYLKTLYGMFAGDWRLAVMAYNAGEYRVMGALKRGGQVARNATPETLPGLSPITHAYVRKLHALSCLLEQADDREEWLQALDRPVPRLQTVTLPEGVTDIAGWARRNGQDAAQLQRLNPAFAGGRITRADGKPARLLAVAAAGPESSASGAVDVTASTPLAMAADSSAPGTALADVAVPIGATDSSPSHAKQTDTPAPPAPQSSARRHTVLRGENASKIAARYGLRAGVLLERNGLDAASVLRPGTVLLIDAGATAGDVPKTAAATP